MSEVRQGNWKYKYIPWYRIIESVFGDDVPRLTDEEIVDCVSNEDWIIVPVAGEKDKENAKQAQRPNLFFDLSGHRNIKNTLIYTQLIDFQDDEFVARVAHSEKEVCQLIEVGFEYVCDHNGNKIFRKRK